MPSLEDLVIRSDFLFNAGAYEQQKILDPWWKAIFLHLIAVTPDVKDDHLGNKRYQISLGSVKFITSLDHVESACMTKSSPASDFFDDRAKVIPNG